MLAQKNEQCRYCGSKNLTQFLDLGNHPPSNSFIKPEFIKDEERHPLQVYFCGSCWLVQLLHVVPAEVLFSEYLYLSSTSQALRNHYKLLVAQATAQFPLLPGDVVVDIGCNDGILLKEYSSPGVKRVGVEPSQVGELAKEAGLEVIKAFFEPEVASEIVSRHGSAKLVTATNVFAHVDNIDRFVQGLNLLLREDGVFIIEAPYLIDLIDQTLFDTIYHEHLCYLGLTPMVPFFAKHGLQIFDVERVPIGASGPAIRVYVQKAKTNLPGQSVDALLAFERQWGVNNPDRYFTYAERVETVRTDALKLIAKLKSSGARFGGYTAPAKGNTLLNYLELTAETVECIAENNKLKQGLVTPGSHIPIVSEEEFLQRQPDYALLLSWNYLDFFLQKSEYIKKGGRFLVPLPSPRIMPDA